MSVVRMVDYMNTDTVRLLRALLARAAAGQRIEVAASVRIDGHRRCYLTGSFGTNPAMVALASKDLADRVDSDDSETLPPMTIT